MPWAFLVHQEVINLIEITSSNLIHGTKARISIADPRGYVLPVISPLGFPRITNLTGSSKKQREPRIPFRRVAAQLGTLHWI